MPTSSEIIGQQLTTIALLRKAVGNSQLTADEAQTATNFLDGLAMALPVHQHIAYTLQNCTDELVAKAFAAKDAAAAAAAKAAE